jgi:hypothetical protein
MNTPKPVAKRHCHTFSGTLKKCLGPILLIILFALAELGPETIADQKNPWIGTWEGTSNSTLNKFILMIEDDGSFSWTAGEKRLMSGTYEVVQPKTLRLHFGGTSSETLDYQYQFADRDKFKLHQSTTDFTFKRRLKAE